MAPSSVGVRGRKFDMVPAFEAALALHYGRNVVNADALPNGLEWRRTRFASPNATSCSRPSFRDP